MANDLVHRLQQVQSLHDDLGKSIRLLTLSIVETIEEKKCTCDRPDKILIGKLYKMRNQQRVYIIGTNLPDTQDDTVYPYTKKPVVGYDIKTGEVYKWSRIGNYCSNISHYDLMEICQRCLNTGPTHMKAKES